MGIGLVLLALPRASADPSGTNGVPVTEVSTGRPASETEEWGSVRFTNDYASPFLWGKAYITARGLPASKDKHRFEVLNADYTRLTGPQEFIRDGIFDLGVLVVPGRKPGEIVFLMLRAWEMQGEGSYDRAILKWSVVFFGKLGGGSLPGTSLEEWSTFRGTDIWPWWGDSFGVSWPPEPSHDVRIQLAEDGAFEISAVCPQIPFKEYFIAASRNMRDWEVVAELGLRPSTEDRLVKWKAPAPESGPVFYRVIP